LAAVQANDAAATAIAAANHCSEEVDKCARMKASAVIGAAAASEIAPPIQSVEAPGAVGDLGFTVYASLSGDFCVDFVPPAVDLSVSVSDRLMEVDGVATRGKSLAEVTRMLCGAVGSYATIKLFRFPQNGAPFFVETTLLRLPVLSEELRASMYPKYNASRKVFAEAQSSAGTTKTATPSSQIVQSPPSAAAAAAAPAPTPAPAPAPAAAPASEAESNVASAMTTNVSQSKAVSLQMESIHVWTKESLTQVWHAAFTTCRVFSPS
jgi:hypothetical protein